jgi:hypothetical protein
MTCTTAKSTDLTIWVITEIAVTIIAASIPVLRVLIRDVHSTARRYYVSRGSGKDSRLTTDKSATGGSLYGGRSRATATVASMNGPTAPRSPDNWSDKSILESAAPTGRIKQTHEIKVEYGVDKYDLSSEYEMGPVGHRS